MADIRINQLPVGSGPLATDFLPLDNGTTRKATVQAIVEIGRPTASQAEAESGTNPTKVMTPLTTAQAVAFYGLLQANNLSDIDSAISARTNLGLDSAWLIALLESSVPSLPTILPGTPGKLWNNGGILSIS